MSTRPTDLQSSDSLNTRTNKFNQQCLSLNATAIQIRDAGTREKTADKKSACETNMKELGEPNTTQTLGENISISIAANFHVFKKTSNIYGSCLSLHTHNGECIPLDNINKRLGKI